MKCTLNINVYIYIHIKTVFFLIYYFIFENDYLFYKNFYSIPHKNKIKSELINNKYSVYYSF